MTESEYGVEFTTVDGGRATIYPYGAVSGVVEVMAGGGAGDTAIHFRREFGLDVLWVREPYDEVIRRLEGGGRAD